jgi:phosphoglycolate phosphatase
VNEVAAAGPRVVLFDLDGTLSESEPGICGTLKLAIASTGLPVPSDEALRSLIGPPFAIALPALGIPADRVDEITAAYRTIYEHTGLYETCLYAGATEMLERLLDKGCTLALATSKPETSSRRVIEHLGLSDHFTVIGAASDDYLRHTKADVIAHALAQLDLDESADVVMVGDRRFDIEGAAAHGIDAIGVAWGYGSLAELQEAGAWAIADDPGEVVSLVAGR